MKEFFWGLTETQKNIVVVTGTVIVLCLGAVSVSIILEVIEMARSA